MLGKHGGCPDSTESAHAHDDGIALEIPYDEFLALDAAVLAAETASKTSTRTAHIPNENCQTAYTTANSATMITFRTVSRGVLLQPRSHNPVRAHIILPPPDALVPPSSHSGVNPSRAGFISSAFRSQADKGDVIQPPVNATGNGTLHSQVEPSQMEDKIIIQETNRKPRAFSAPPRLPETPAAAAAARQRLLQGRPEFRPQSFRSPPGSARSGIPVGDRNGILKSRNLVGQLEQRQGGLSDGERRIGAAPEAMVGFCDLPVAKRNCTGAEHSMPYIFKI